MRAILSAYLIPRASQPSIPLRPGLTMRMTIEWKRKVGLVMG